MRQTLLSTLVLCAVVSSNVLSQSVPCSDLFISEYVEGSGNNKCLEFFNPTNETIDLSMYELQRWSNGEGGVTDATQLIGELPPLTTWVLVNGQTEDVDLGGGQISPYCDPDLQQLADQLDNPYPAPTYMNGNDALVLVKNGTTPVDIFGKPGENPGVAWTDNPDANFISVSGVDTLAGAWLTSNHTLRRKYEVTSGVIAPPVAFNTLLEWDTLGINVWDHLGQHSCECGSTAIHEVVEKPSAKIYPNPSSTGALTLETTLDVAGIEVYNPAGQLIQSLSPSNGIRRWDFETESWNTGVYFVNIEYASGSIYSHRVVIR